MRKPIRKRVQRKKREAMDIDITSLLDILVVILIFLLKSYSTSNVIINVPKEVQLPRSESIDLNSEGITLQVSGDKIFVDDQEVADLTKKSTLYTSGDDLLINPLYDELVRKKESIENLKKMVDGAKAFTGVVNLVMDKKVKYDFLRKLMYTCGEAGYVQFKFVVLNQNT